MCLYATVSRLYAHDAFGRNICAIPGFICTESAMMVHSVYLLKKS